MDYFDYPLMPANLGNQVLLLVVRFEPTLTSIQVGTPATGPGNNAQATVSVSTAFNPLSLLDTLPPDLILVSSDSVFFYLHRQRILNASTNSFYGLLSPERLKEAGVGTPLYALTEPAEVVNIIMHTIYNMSCTHYGPSFATVSAAVEALGRYGIPVQRYAAPPLPLYTLVLSHARTHPIDAYSLAAAHNLETLAVAISPHLLAFHLSELSEELASAIGPRYLLRLFRLHETRMAALKRLLLQPPSPHEPNSSCGVGGQGKLTRGWAFATAQLVWDARPSISTHVIHMALSPLETQLTCKLCIESLERRVQEVIAGWAAVKRTI
ncbi:hypothetical protein OBBRIDRAFT_887141 [Obba rivulosa]|uniref:BTB domain-containing protein n=1 Tax=Obba rivulosa TaxID=1052685 RepID=A0A8E2AZU7_9APHY|nr:hypothetical protein OBBRIDRAFT_887141 [Obba rivulosa]